MISAVDGCLLWPVAAGGVLAEADAVARLEGLLARALEANERLAALVERQREEIASFVRSWPPGTVSWAGERRAGGAEADAVRPVLGTGPALDGRAAMAAR